MDLFGDGFDIGVEEILNNSVQENSEQKEKGSAETSDELSELWEENFDIGVAEILNNSVQETSVHEPPEEQKEKGSAETSDELSELWEENFDIGVEEILNNSVKETSVHLEPKEKGSTEASVQSQPTQGGLPPPEEQKGKGSAEALDDLSQLWEENFDIGVEDLLKGFSITPAEKEQSQKQTLVASQRQASSLLTSDRNSNFGPVVTSFNDFTLNKKAKKFNLCKK
eukprot:TRINITY_DN2243_c0_g1_i1.p1 TRINITY_DN2243_c0_g1~~TRINITY_DN2243_c0_g1_i1.p1  ORF type:complete len:237 (+),score=88.56 TRINITY_DN2243_c0_g1_i1:35-712(+)